MLKHYKILGMCLMLVVLFASTAHAQALTADAGDPVTGVTGKSVTFDGSGSTGEITSYSWEFGDGGSAGPSPTPTGTYIYFASSTYEVKLTVTDALGNTAEDTTTATINEEGPPVANAGGPYEYTIGGETSFDGSASTDPYDNITRYAWDFGDGTFGEGAMVTHTYETAAETPDHAYGVGLTVTSGGSGASDIDNTSVALIVTDLPVADAGPDVMGTVGSPVTFDGSASTDPTGQISQWDWDFGDGTLHGNTEIVEHVYLTPDTYRVTLTVLSGDTTATDTDTTEAIITEGSSQPPVADAGGPYKGTVGVAVTFNGSNSTGSIESYNWDFGDGATDVGAIVDHVYDTPGQYIVGLTLVETGTGAFSGAQTIADISSGGPPPDGGEVSKLVAQGDTLPDGLVLTQILLDGGVALNTSGQVAFGGRDSTDNDPGVFTQAGLVVKTGDTLEDGTIMKWLIAAGEVAIGVSPSGDVVAFHGQAESGDPNIPVTNGVFTKAGVVALAGQTFPDSTTLDVIKSSGKVAINDFGQIAFHGAVIDQDFGDFESAVFTQEGVLVKEGDTLGDSSFVFLIDETGGVAINQSGLVAFHAEVDNPDASFPPQLRAVFTQEGLVVQQGETLGDGTTIVADIDENGGVAINFFGHVAVHGDVVVSETGDDTVTAVFTQEGIVVKEGDTLGDGTVVEEINQVGGVGINFFGDVVFHGRTDGVKAVFTQHGLVAKEGQVLTDGTTLDAISDNGGVAINLLGEVAFHGKVGTTDTVFLGTAP